jgi:hypothetical protein
MANSSDTAPRNPSGAAQMLADALLRTVGGASAQLRVNATNTDGAMCEVGVVATTFAEVVLSPVVMRKLRPAWQQAEPPRWELLVSATSVQKQISALSLDSAQSLFAMTATITVGEQDYLLESIASNEAFGQIYLYRLLLREARQQAV